MAQGFVETLVEEPAACGGAGRFELRPGKRVGRYELLHVLGAGGMGVVFAAHDTVLDRQVALKVVPEGYNRKSRRRLLREARAMARLDHPNVVQVLGVEESGPNVFIAMELIDGLTLSRWMSSEPRSWRQVLRVLVDAGRGLAAAHAAGIMHLDFKPDNVMIARDGRVYVLDFGLARALKSVTARLKAVSGPAVPWTLEDSVTPHRAGGGTPRYMAPEQIARQDCDERTDQFSYCVTAMEALFRAHPFPATSMGELAGKVARGIVRRPRCTSGVPAPIRAALLRGVKANPQDRHPSMVSLLRVLESHMSARPRLVLVASAVALAAVSLMAAWPTGSAATEQQAAAASLTDTAGHDVPGWEDSQSWFESARTRGDLREAERRARESLALARKAADPRRVAVARNQLAAVLREMRRPDLAQDMYEVAYFEARDGEHSEMAAEAAIELATLLAEAPGSDAQARTWIRHARAQLDRSERDASTPPARLRDLRARLDAAHVATPLTGYKKSYPGLQ